MVEINNTGKKAVAFITIEVLVEVDETTDYNDMIEKAKEKLKKHVVAGNGFFPYREKATMVQSDTTVNNLITRLTIQPGTGWYDS